jgi:hypothetical protein
LLVVIVRLSFLLALVTIIGFVSARDGDLQTLVGKRKIRYDGVSIVFEERAESEAKVRVLEDTAVTTNAIWTQRSKM